MRFEPEDFLTVKDDNEYLSGIQISPNPAILSLLLILFITSLSFFVDIWMLPEFLLRIYYGLLFSRILLLVYCLIAFFTYMAGRIELTRREIRAANLPLSRFRPLVIEVSCIRKVSVRHGLFGKLFKYGTLILTTENARPNRFFFVRNPSAVKKYMESLL